MKNATIRWFDSMTGEGFVRLDDGSCVFVHFTAIDSINKNNYHYPAECDKIKLTEMMRNGRACLVDVFEDFNYRQVSRLVLL